VLRRYPKLSIALAFMCMLAMWLYVRRVLVAHQRADAAVRHVPRGNLSDLYPRWLGSRELLLHHRDPYSADVTREIQSGYYGRPLDPSRPEDPKDQQAFAYPVYVAILLAPTVYFPFELLRKGFDAFLIVFTAASVWLWMRAIGWQEGFLAWLVAAVLVLGSFPAVQGVKLDQLTLLVAGFIAWSAFLLSRQRLFAAGMVLAVSTVKPQLVMPLMACLILWAVADWAHRRSLVWGFCCALGFLLVISEVILPGWMHKFRVALREYVAYTGGVSLIDRLLSPGVGKVMTVAVFAFLLALVWKRRRAEPGSRDFSVLFAEILAATLLIIPTFAPYNQLLLLPAVLLTAREWQPAWRSGPLSRAILVATVIALGWQWLTAFGLVLVSLRFPLIAQNAWTVPLYTVLVIPFVVLLDVVLLDRGPWLPQPPYLPQLAMDDGKR
jgi:Glycosyltransferase family 87